MPELLKVHGIGKANVAEWAIPGDKYFAVLLDKSTLVLAPRRDQIEDVLEKAAGDRKTELKDPALQQLIKARDLKQAVNAVGTSDMVVHSRYKATENEKATVNVTHERLKDFGIEALTGGASVGNDIRGKVTLTAKDGDSAQKLNGMLEQGLNKIKAEGEQELVREKDFAPVLEALKTIKIATKDKAVSLEAHAGPDAVRATFIGLFAGTAEVRKRPAIRPEPARDK
jgi:hypothetical protein